MSRLSATVEKPFTKTLKWGNDKFKKQGKEMVLVRPKGWYWYEKPKNEGEEGVNHLLESPFTFIWLESAVSFTGFNDENQASIYSNEVLDMNTLKEYISKEGLDFEDYQNKLKEAMILKAKMGKDTIATGLYKDIKDTVKAKGGKYCQAVYGLLQTNEGVEIVRFLMYGSSGQSWISFDDKSKRKSMAIAFTGETIEKTKGDNTYECPVFKYVPATKELIKEADNAALKVTTYFKYLMDNLEPVNEKELTTVEEGERQPWEDKD